MNMKKINRLLFSVLCVLALIVVASASTATFQTNSTNDCVYGPDSGELTATFFADTAKTELSFVYSATDIQAINTYNAAGLYAGVDIKNVPYNYSGANTGYDKMGAYTVFTSLPNPVEDLENDDILGTRNEEVDVVILGQLTAGMQYTVTAYWNDYRNGGDTDNGWWYANAELSEKGLSDYNVFNDNWCHLTMLAYGKNQGAP